MQRCYYLPSGALYQHWQINMTGYLAVGGLVLTRTPDIEMRLEELYVSEKEIRVRYRFFNTSKTDIKTLVAFPIPDLAPLGDNEYAMPTEDPVNFLAFETKVDGKPVTNGIEQRAVVDGTDHTDLLKSLHIPLSPAHDSTQKALNALSQEQQTALVKAGIVREEEADFGKGMRKYAVPNCTLKTAFHWEQIFLVQKDSVVEHRYSPFVGGNVGYLTSAMMGYFTSETASKPSDKILADYNTRYCTDSDFLAAVKRQRAKKPATFITLPEAQLEYVLVTGANWAKPIKDFRLVVDKGEPDSLVSFCATGVKRSGRRNSRCATRIIRRTGIYRCLSCTGSHSDGGLRSRWDDQSQRT